MRQSGKVKNLSANFRCGAKKTYEQAHVNWGMSDVTIEEVYHWNDAWKRLYKGIPNYWKEAIFKAKQRGYAETLAGRRFYIDRWIKDRWASESSAIMVPIQGTGADMKYLAIALMRMTFPELAFWGEIHDEVIYVSRIKPTPEYLLKIKRVLD
ncbi:hypothetical protein KA005_59075, partial [bacterium]|nr:hypothetical protein [bacterium]